ncbi:PASTA domain-containing protein, partial [Veillonella sp.]
NTTVDVPNVVGKQVSVAKNILEDKHLRVSTSEVTNPDVPAGQVISQTPGAGEKVKEQRTIHLVVSKGVGDITVPDLTDLTVDQARQRLKDLGLVVGKITQQSVDGKKDGVIIAQSPSGDSKVSKGTTIDLVVNKAKAKKVKVPNLVGMTLKDARDTLSNIQLGVNQVSGSVEEKSVVIEQSIKAGDEIDEGSTLNLTTEFKDDKKKSDKKEGNSGNKTTGTIDVTVPAGSKNQELKIVVKDDEGSAVIYDDTNKPGDRVVKKVSGVGNVRIEVYLNGALVQETAL